MSTTSTPESWRPNVAADFIGDAARVVTKLGQKIQRRPLAAQRWLFLGPPGVGKTAAAIVLAKGLAAHPTGIEHVNGQSCTVDLVRQWRDALPYRPMFGPGVKLIDELDLASPAAQHELLTVLDRLPEWQHVIATTNQNLDVLQPRLQSRFQQYAFEPPHPQEIQGLLARFGLVGETAKQIAKDVAGNVRAGLLDAQSVIDMA